MMGGSADRNLDSNITHLIATEWGSRKCKVATELGKPVMTCSWIDHVWTASATQLISAVDPDVIKDHRLPIFHDVVISVGDLT